MNDLAIYCVNESYTIREVLSRIDENRNRAVLLVDENECVTGIVSQGDIIRALASGADMLSSIGQYASPSFFFLKSRDLARAYKLLKTRGMTLFPVVDDQFRLLDVVTIYEVLDYIEDEMNEGR